MDSDELTDETVADEVSPEIEPELEKLEKLDDTKTMKQLRLLAARSALGKTPKTPLLCLTEDGDWENVEDERFYIVFADASAEAQDAVRDSLEQYRQSGQYEVDEETGQVVGDVEIKQFRRAWPVIEVALEFKLIADACLPQFGKSGDLEVLPYRWRGSKHMDRQFLQRGGTTLTAMLVHMLSDHVMGNEERRVVEALGE